MIKEINFSKKAVEKINQLVAKKPSGTFFRIAVKGGGCSGFKYDFTFDNKIHENDLNDLKQDNYVANICFKAHNDQIAYVNNLENSNTQETLTKNARNRQIKHRRKNMDDLDDLYFHQQIYLLWIQH